MVKWLKWGMGLLAALVVIYFGGWYLVSQKSIQVVVSSAHPEWQLGVGDSQVWGVYAGWLSSRGMGAEEWGEELGRMKWVKVQPKLLAVALTDRVLAGNAVAREGIPVMGASLMPIGEGQVALQIYASEEILSRPDASAVVTGYVVDSLKYYGDQVNSTPNWVVNGWGRWLKWNKDAKLKVYRY